MQTVAARGAYRALEGKVQDEARRAAESRRIWNHLKNDKVGAASAWLAQVRLQCRAPDLFGVLSPQASRSRRV